MNEYDSDNVFAKILAKEIPCEVVLENNQALAFEDVNKVADVHVIAVPKGRYISYHDFMEKASNEEIIGLFSLIKDVIKKLGISENGYRIVTNFGKSGMQTVSHLHFHIISSDKRLGGMVSSTKSSWQG